MDVDRDIARGILRCADKSTAGEMTYHDNTHVVVPLEVKQSFAMAAGPDTHILYCSDGGKTKMFYVHRIQDFKPTPQKVSTPFPIKKENLHHFFDRFAGRMEDEIDEEMEDEVETDVNPAERMTKHASFDERRVMRIAQKIMEFSGAEAHLYVPGKTEDSYDEVGDDGRG